MNWQDSSSVSLQIRKDIFYQLFFICNNLNKFSKKQSITIRDHRDTWVSVRTFYSLSLSDNILFQITERHGSKFHWVSRLERSILYLIRFLEFSNMSPLNRPLKKITFPTLEWYGTSVQVLPLTILVASSDRSNWF